jgi:hypothetical protein
MLFGRKTAKNGKNSLFSRRNDKAAPGLLSLKQIGQ